MRTLPGQGARKNSSSKETRVLSGRAGSESDVNKRHVFLRSQMPPERGASGKSSCSCWWQEAGGSTLGRGWEQTQQPRSLEFSQRN